MKHKTQVVMLPMLSTLEDIAPLWLYSENRLEIHCLNESLYKETPIPQHLYITVSQDIEPIKEGDWYHYVGHILQYEKDEHTLTPNCRKIIATTDPKLRIGDLKTYFAPDFKYVPQLQQSFLKEYVANPDGNWEVEYELLGSKINGIRTTSRLKLNQDNTVNITSVKEKMYSRGEVESLLFKYAEEEHAWFSSKSEIESLNNWIKENLKL